MPTAISRGDDTPQLQSQSYMNEWMRGGTYTEEWKGINPAKMIAKWNGVGQTAKRAQMTIGQGLAELRLEWGGTSDGAGGSSSIAITMDRWETPEPRVERELLSHPSLISIVSSMVSTDTQLFDVLAIMRQCATQAQSSVSSQSSEKIFRDILEDYLAAQGLSSPPLTIYATTAFLRFYHLFANNQTHFQSSQFALRHTTSAPAYWSLNRADINVNRIYSPALFMSEVTDGGLWYLPLPGRLQYKLAAAVTAFSAVTPARSNFMIGWLKAAASEASAPRGNIDIQSSYVLDQWSTDVYPLAI